MKTRYYIFILFYSIIVTQCFSQTSEKLLLHKLDSITNSPCAASYFASLYLGTSINAATFFSKYQEPVRHSIQRFEHSFANYFFASVQACSQEKEIPKEWKDYFIQPSLSPLQYQLLGINAHINGDIWKALTTTFTLPELLEIKNYYHNYNESLKEFYYEFYGKAYACSSRIRLLHLVSFGLDKEYGRMMLYRWRKRQMHLAILYFNDPPGFEKQHKKLEKKMQRLNYMILHRL
ncbi:MAG: DUF5995 family protein [Bacteroidota bacterium]